MMRAIPHLIARFRQFFVQFRCYTLPALHFGCRDCFNEVKADDAFRIEAGILAKLEHAQPVLAIKSEKSA
jgi:hypothetical protein